MRPDAVRSCGTVAALPEGTVMLNDPKTIMVFLDASPSGKRRATHAITLAQRWGAHLVGVFAGVVLPGYMCNVRGSDAIAHVIAFEQQLDVDAAAAAVLISEHYD
jgi:hypothetical protein